MNSDFSLSDRLEQHSLVQTRDALAQQTAVQQVPLIQQHIAANCVVAEMTVAREFDSPDAVRPSFVRIGYEIREQRCTRSVIDPINLQPDGKIEDALPLCVTVRGEQAGAKLAQRAIGARYVRGSRGST